MTSNHIKRQLYRHYNGSDYKLTNTFIFDFESDFFCMSKSEYAIEVEIKVSRSDFFADFKKRDQFTKYENGKYVSKVKSKHDILQDKTMTYKPNKFFFAFPAGLIKTDEVPKYAGIIEVSDHSINFVRQAPFLHKEILRRNIKFVQSLCDKFYYRCMDLRNSQELRDIDLKYGQRRLDFRLY